MSTENKNYALPIAMMFALFFMVAFVTGLPSPMGVIVAKQFGASNFESQLGFLGNFLAYAFMGIPAGIMLKKFGYKKTALSAIAVGFVGVAVQFLSGQVGSFTVYLVGTFISGFSMCMLNTVVNPMLNTLGGGGNSGNRLLQFGGSINSIGATITPMLVGFLMGAEAGRTIEKANPALFLALGIFALAFVVLSFVKIPEPHMETASERKVKHSHSPLSFRHFVLGAIAIFIYVGIEIGIPSTANLFMTASKTASNVGLGIDATTAGSIVGVYWLLMLIGRLTGASIGAKVSSKTMLIGVSSLGIILVLLAIFSPITSTVSMPVFKSNLSFGIAQVPISILYLALCGLCTSIMWGGIFNLAVEGLGKYTAAASGIFMVMVCGGGIVPLFQGFVSDHLGYLNSYWVMFACLGYMLFYGLIGSKNVNKDIPVE
ncbi:major facilitator superfamily MFS_1 [Paludibacter propionicigenes WB4]|uniref:Major facilitator superfamily MFS_1 n=1 Tax=Paludibacter propionicigenes (strain DSM 17365 / JCM 13257 / WB4) TaxID=694427 RepID=E4T0H9_PALPW|nr:MFS transporter [Paludibacter propionicigenes]ADQ78338.1 major facilitator superfamily MFS_1 [Paludibacter propionicigenes WB4]